MKIYMIEALRLKGEPTSGRVWWWRVREDDDSPIEKSKGWEWKRELAYAAAMRRLRELKKDLA